MKHINRNLVGMKLCGGLMFGAIAIAPAAAQKTTPSAPAETNSTITVTGTKANKVEVRREARTFVGKAIVPEYGQFARRNDPLCPTVIGIDKSYADIVVTQIRDIAKNSRVKLAEPGCKANVHIMFVNDSNGFMTKLGKAAPGVFSLVPAPELQILRTNLVPIRWWYATEFKGSDGMRPRYLPQGNQDYISLKSFSSSLIDSKIIVNLVGTIVVVDMEKATGYPLASIGAYAAMVSLVQIKNGKDFSEASSILNLFGPSQTATNAPTDLTRWDYAFVSSLYEIPPNRPGNIQKSQLATRMAAKLSQ